MQTADHSWASEAEIRRMAEFEAQFGILKSLEPTRAFGDYDIKKQVERHSSKRSRCTAARRIRLHVRACVRACACALLCVTSEWSLHSACIARSCGAVLSLPDIYHYRASKAETQRPFH